MNTWSGNEHTHTLYLPTSLPLCWKLTFRFLVGGRWFARERRMWTILTAGTRRFTCACMSGLCLSRAYAFRSWTIDYCVRCISFTISMRDAWIVSMLPLQGLTHSHQLFGSHASICFPVFVPTAFITLARKQYPVIFSRLIVGGCTMMRMQFSQLFAPFIYA